MAGELTITEALAEIKMLGKRIEKKRQGLTNYVARQEAMKDPLEKEGGSVEFIKGERQAVRDLGERIVELRRAIAKANAETMVSVNGDTRSIADWLTWRREVAPGRQSEVRTLLSEVEGIRQQAQQKGLGFVTAVAQVGGDVKPTDVLVNVSEVELLNEADHLETVLGVLDGQLSLKNATTTI